MNNIILYKKLSTLPDRQKPPALEKLIGDQKGSKVMQRFKIRKCSEKVPGSQQGAHCD